MKKFVFNIVCVLMLGGIFANPVCLPGPVAQVHLIGKLKLPDTKGITSQPIEVFQNEDELELYFLSSLALITITVTDEKNGTVYQKTVNATAGSSLTVDMKGWASGEYTLLITDGQGGYLEGVFEIE